MRVKDLRNTALAGLSALVLVAAPIFAQEDQNVVEYAQSNEALSTLVSAVVEAELVDTLSDDSANYTVFAPTNEAFAALPEGTLNDLLDPANRDQLVDVLTYHVIDSEAFAADLEDGQTLTTLQGQEVSITLEGTDVFVNGNAVVNANRDVNNGVVHVIDGVLLPENLGELHNTANTNIGENITSPVAIGFGLLVLIGVTAISYGFISKKLN